MRDADPHRWTHPATILVATDLSDLDHLMPFALEQAGETGARLILLHVLSSAAAITADAAGMPYYDTVGALEISRADAAALVRSCRAARHPLRRAGARRPPHATDCSRCPPISCRPHAAWDSEPEQDRQVAHRLCGRTSAALGLPPGHYRGTRGSSPGGQEARNVSSCMPPRFERPPARARRLPAGSRPHKECKVDPVARASADRGDAAQRPAYRARLGRHASNCTHACRRNRRGLLLLR